tara:strand:- start:260 stop:385 length:126 start_codon:yes stop_codon:yes gene_type:complete
MEQDQEDQTHQLFQSLQQEEVVEVIVIRGQQLLEDPEVEEL